MALSKNQIQQIRTMAFDGHTEEEICKAVGVSRGTVFKYKPKKNEHREKENEQFIQKYTKVKNELNDKWLDKLLKDDRQAEITDKVLNLLNDKDLLDREILKDNGLRAIVGMYKTIVDTAAKLKDLNLRQEKQEQENILNETYSMNDNFENAMMQAVKPFAEVDYKALIEKDSIDSEMVN